MDRIKVVIIASFLLLVCMGTGAHAGSASITGTVKDQVTGESLPGANVLLLGTSIGAASDLGGKYTLRNVPARTYTIRATYVGYKTVERTITVTGDAELRSDFALSPVGVEGETVVVTGQASGQSQAINQQLASNQIVNVVSAAKIQELPDANAAESVGRLPGVMVLRSGGEGNAVVIRGLEPKYNKILIDGVQMSSADAADRTTDLSTVSSSMLDGIRVSKTVTPDMDADVFGGTVDFSLREAKAGEGSTPRLEGTLQGGYNGLSNIRNKYNNYKFVLSGEDRYLESRLGIFAQVDMERKNLGSNELGAVYTHAGTSMTDYYTSGLGLSMIGRDRNRFNGTLVVDYKLENGFIKFSNFGTSGSSDIHTRYELFDIQNNNHLYQLSHSGPALSILSNSLAVEHAVAMFQVDLKVAHSYSEVKDPDNWLVNFQQTSAGLSAFNNVAAVNPEDVPKAATNDFFNTITNGIATGHNFSKERAMTVALDLKTNVAVSDGFNADIKFGGKYRYETRTYTTDLYNGGGLQFGDALYLNNLIINYFHLPVQPYRISLPYFTDPGFSYGKFLDGKYTLVSPMDYGRISSLIDLVRAHTADIAAYPGAAQVYGLNTYSSTSNNYTGNEQHTAGYAMAVANLGEAVTIIGGVRYQNLRTSYTGVRGVQNRLSYLVYKHDDTTTVQSHGFWLPNASVRYKPLPWCDLRVSFSKTLAYPDFNAIIPRIDFDGNNSIVTYNNYALVPQRSTNFDAYLSFYDNTVGLLTLGGFLKQIDDQIYGWTFFANGTKLLQYLPSSVMTAAPPTNYYQVVTYVNNAHRATVRGVEIDWQTHFWYLPDPLSGLILSVNYTHIFSETEYPYSMMQRVGRQNVPVDSSFTDRLLDQPNDIANVSVGFDYKGFSVLVSMLYQSDIFTGVNFWPQLRSHTSAYTRWDMVLKQDLPWYGFQVFCNLNNINGVNDVSVIQGGGVPIAEQQYGLTIDAGVRFRF